MLRSGDTRVRVTLTITPCINRVCDWKIRLNSFCRSRAMRFCLVSCIVGVVFRVMCVAYSKLTCWQSICSCKNICAFSLNLSLFSVVR